MSRAINVKASETDVINRCAKHGATVSAIEALVSGGTRVVLNNGDDAAVMRHVFRKELITGEVERIPLRSWAR